MKKKSWFG